MDQAEAEHHSEWVRRLDADRVAETVEIVEALVDDGDRDRGVDEVMIRLDAEQRRPKQGNAVAERKGSDELKDLPEPRQEEHHAEQKEQVVVARQHIEAAGL